MRLPARRSEFNRKYGRPADDHYLTPAKIARLKDDLGALEKTDRPKAVEDLARAREMGDLSENAAYAEAKARLGRIDGRVFCIRERLKQAVTIETGPDASGRVRVGCIVTVRSGGREKDYEIVGSQETDPARGRISHLSPLGSALVGKRAGDKVSVSGPQGAADHEIVRIR